MDFAKHKIQLGGVLVVSLSGCDISNRRYKYFLNRKSFSSFQIVKRKFLNRRSLCGQFGSSFQIPELNKNQCEKQGVINK